MASTRLASALIICLASVLAGAAHARNENPIFVSLQSSAQSMATDTDKQARETAIAALMQKVGKNGHLRVIVELKMPARTADALASEQPAAAATLKTLQSNVLARIWARRSGADAWRFRYGPFLAMNVDATALKRLLADRDIVNIQEDARFSADNIQYDMIKIKAPALWHLGIKGTGYAVAVLDTGVQTDHPMLAGKVVSEACYSRNDLPNSSSFCPGGANSSTAKGSGTYCPLSIRGCYHGTHVAGTAVGKELSEAQGVASGSKLIAIQVFHKGLNAEACDDSPIPCTYSATSNIQAALEHVYELRNKYKIASINLSVGGGEYTSHCDSEEPGIAHIMKLLKEAGIATFAASGNEYFTGAISAPACISSAIAVGSTNEDDAVSSFSNHSKLVGLMAPGQKIVSAMPESRYGPLSGTSMATPHAAGAFAVLRQAEPKATVDQIVEALKGTGVPVTRDGITKPRIDELGAYDALTALGPQAAAR